MTSKEAKKILNEYRNRNYTSTLKTEVELAKAIDVVLPKYVELEERDTPMLPVKLKWENTENYYYVCPKCEEMVARDDEVFCQDCGQRLLWRYDK